MPVLVRVLAILAPVAFVPVLASAQPAGPAPSSTEPTNASAPPPASPDADAPAAAPAKPVIPATGYSYSEPAPAAARADRPHPRAAGASNGPGTDALMTGFETLADGSTRLFVALSKPVSYDTKATASALTFVLKDVHVDRRNNQNPLVTVHFNTPVTNARLVPHGRDLWFVVDLRASVQPTVTMVNADAAKESGAMLRVEFAKGEYLARSSEKTPAALAPAHRPQASASAATP